MGDYVECPNEYTGDGRALFLAGGITGCGDWQADAARELRGEGWAILNPRRKSFDTTDPDIDKVQIPWEYKHLRRADAILFWFPPETLCPITLYELGVWNVSQKPIFLGIHPEYKRRGDVEIQTRLIRPDIAIHYSLQDLLAKVQKCVRQEMSLSGEWKDCFGWEENLL